MVAVSLKMVSWGGIVIVMALVFAHKATGAEESHMVSGAYLGPGAECPQFELLSGERISLSGVRDHAFTKGEIVNLHGRWRPVSTCMQGRDFLVTEVVPAGSVGGHDADQGKKR